MWNIFSKWGELGCKWGIFNVFSFRFLGVQWNFPYDALSVQVLPIRKGGKKMIRVASRKEHPTPKIGPRKPICQRSAPRFKSRTGSHRTFKVAILPGHHLSVWGPKSQWNWLLVKTPLGTWNKRNSELHQALQTWLRATDTSAAKRIMALVVPAKGVLLRVAAGSSAGVVAVLWLLRHLKVVDGCWGCDVCWFRGWWILRKVQWYVLVSLGKKGCRDSIKVPYHPEQSKEMEMTKRRSWMSNVLGCLISSLSLVGSISGNKQNTSLKWMSMHPKRPFTSDHTMKMWCLGKHPKTTSVVFSLSITWSGWWFQPLWKIWVSWDDDILQQLKPVPPLTVRSWKQMVASPRRDGSRGPFFRRHMCHAGCSLDLGGLGKIPARCALCAFIHPTSFPSSIASCLNMWLVDLGVSPAV